jgi:hypothetical protein
MILGSLLGWWMLALRRLEEKELGADPFDRLLYLLSTAHLIQHPIP